MAKKYPSKLIKEALTMRQAGMPLKNISRFLYGNGIVSRRNTALSDPTICRLLYRESSKRGVQLKPYTRGSVSKSTPVAIPRRFDEERFIRAVLHSKKMSTSQMLDVIKIYLEC